MEKKQVVIIGAGISGLLACKYCLSKGFNPMVFESQSDIGGVWAKTSRTTRLQSFKGSFQFSDFPWPSSVTQDYPTQHQLLNYLRSYATRFDLMNHIQFNSVVKGIEYDGPPTPSRETFPQGKWKVTVENSQSTKVHDADFVILCVGRFKDFPNIPEFAPGAGPEVFRGKMIHSMEYAAMDHQEAEEFIKGKRVVVVGFQKQGLDIAMECSSLNSFVMISGKENPCTILYRNDRWKLPDFSPWGIPLSYLYFNRFSELLVHKPGEGFLLGLLATILSPLRWGISKLVETHVKKKSPLAKFDMVPKCSFSKDLRSGLVSTMPEDFFNRVETGSILLKRSPGFSFYKEGILNDGENKPTRADIVILATGFKGIQKLQSIFMSQDLRDFIAPSPDSRVPLYRECIPPRIPQVAIIGFSESISNLFTSEMRCRWVVELLDGTFKLPSIKEMEKDISNWDEYMKQSAGEYHQR
ncbi:Flavin monooxygenase-like protein, partial [Cynara cardunculus var. scolymus]